MTQIELPYGSNQTQMPRVSSRMDIRHIALILLIATFPVIPMPIAGGTPILIAVMLMIYTCFFMFPSRAVYLDRIDVTYVFLGLALFAWEGLGLLFHISNIDVLYVLARGLWIALALAVIIAMNILYNRAGIRPVTHILVFSLLFLLFAMWVEINFYPNREYGRDFGTIALPWPRATGVPNSDGKLGTFLSICLCYYLFLRPPMPKWQALVLCVGPFIGLMNTQSRSTLVAFTIIVAFYFIFSLARSRSTLSAFLKLAIVVGGGGYLLINALAILDALIGQGIYRRNVFGRFELFAFALRIIPDAVVFGHGSQIAEFSGEAGNIHNTFLSMAVKSGIPAALLSALTVFAPAIMFIRTKRMSFFLVTVCLAMFAEHFFYPGRFNEYQIVCFMVSKLAWRDLQRQRAQDRLQA